MHLDRIKTIMGGDEAARIYVERGGRTGRDYTCFHEAGHAALSVHSGRVPHRVEVFHDGRGVVLYEDGPVDWAETSSDAAQINNIASVLTICDAALDLESLRAETRSFLIEHWAEVERLARHLISLSCSRDDACISGRLAATIMRGSR
jgi:hypothetical protein